MYTRQVTLLALSFLGMILAASGQPAPKGEQAVRMGYELHSWQQSNGRWNFSLLPSPSGVNVTTDEVFDKKFLLSGTKELKRKISDLPPDATIYWLNRTSATEQQRNEVKKLRYPSTKVVQDIRNYAAAHKIKVELLSHGEGAANSER